MLKIFLLLVSLVLCSLVLAYPVSAQELRIRGVLANPAADESTEWIALENTSTATVSASAYKIRDTLGKVVEFSLSGFFQPQEIRVIPRTQSGITLNNDSEGAELLSNGVVVHSVPTFSAPGNDQVWVELNSGWRYISLEDWQSRVLLRDWVFAVSASPVPTPTPSPSLQSQQAELELSLISPCTSPEWIEVKAAKAGIASLIKIEDSSGQVLKQEELEFSLGESRRLEWAGAKLSNSGEWVRVILPNKESLFSYPACSGSLPFRFYQGKWQQVESITDPAGEGGTTETDTSTPAAALSEEDFTSQMAEEYPFTEPKLISRPKEQKAVPKGFPEPPVPDFADEEGQFLWWKRRSLLGSLSLGVAGVIALLLTLPTLIAWYNVHQDPW